MQNIKNKFIYLFENFFSPKEILLMGIMLVVSVFSFIIFIYFTVTHFMTERIMYSGNITEGIVESPKNPSPYLSVTQVDRDVTKLLFSSLIKNLNGESYDVGLASGIEVSSDKLIYKVTLRPGVYFSNGTPITLDDVIYSIQNATIEKNFEIEKIEPNTLVFKLKSKDTGNFLETFTAPIVSTNEKFDSNFSLSLITSSYFKISKIEKDSDSNLTKLVLERFDNGEEKIPYLKNYTLVFYKTEEEAVQAFQRKEIDLITGVRGSVITKIKDDTDIKFEFSKLPNNFAIFINQNKNEYLRDNALRQAMSDIIDRESLTNQVLGNFGIPQHNILQENKKPLTADEVINNLTKKNGSSFKYENGVLYSSTKKKTADTDTGDNTPTSDKIEVSITTINNEELIETAEFIKNSWEKIGITTTIIIIERNELNTVVKDRDFQNLLFGFSVKEQRDYYSFFSSKERTYPKLNISNYTSINADKILDILRNEKDEARKIELLKNLSVEIEKDNPVIILYKPQFVFAHFLKSHIKLPNTIKSEEERYLDINTWYTDTEKVLKFWNNINFINYLDIYTY